MKIRCITQYTQWEQEENVNQWEKIENTGMHVISQNQGTVSLVHHASKVKHLAEFR